MIWQLLCVPLSVQSIQEENDVRRETTFRLTTPENRKYRLCRKLLSYVCNPTMYTVILIWSQLVERLLLTWWLKATHNGTWTNGKWISRTMLEHSRQNCRKCSQFFCVLRLRSTYMYIVQSGTALTSHNPASTNINKSGGSVLTFRKIPLPDKGKAPWNVGTRVTSYKAATVIVATMTDPNLLTFPWVQTIFNVGRNCLKRKVVGNSRDL